MQNIKKKVSFYFDFLSPYSYFAWINHQKLGLTGLSAIDYRPVLMGRLFDHWGIKGPGEIAPKRYLMLKSCFRYASREEIPFVPPKAHPFNPLYALRLATSACAGDKQSEVISALWSFIWEKGNMADDPERLIAALEAKGLSGEKLLENAFSRDAKQELKQNTQEAIENKVFGVPSFRHKGEVFWGNDSIRDLIYFLDEKESYDRELFESRVSDIEL